MPGYVMHLAVAKRILEICNIKDEDFIEQFKLGSVIPDTRKRTDKKESHYWSDESFKKFVRKPELGIFLEEHGDRLSEPYVFGYYSHLYLDVQYLEQYWTRHFRFMTVDNKPAIWYEEVQKVYMVEDGKVYDIRIFFSDELYYGDYDKMNPYILDRYGIVEKDIVVPVIGEKGWLKLPIIGGIHIPEVLDKLSDMRSLIIKGSESRYKSDEPKVLKLEDMENLIEKTAQELSEKLWAVYR
ncbi:MAG: zinc dependent phospholipase C family protein [Wujia sp.]